jgi:hypothetical protein
MSVLEKVLERLATSDKSTIVVERQPDGKMRVTLLGWEKFVFARSGARIAASGGVYTSSAKGTHRSRRTIRTDRAMSLRA